VPYLLRALPGGRGEPGDRHSQHAVTLHVLVGAVYKDLLVTSTGLLGCGVIAAHCGM